MGFKNYASKNFKTIYIKYKNEEQNKIIALVRQAIDKIAAKEDYDFVLEKGSVLYAKPDSTITSEVVKQVSKLK